MTAEQLVKIKPYADCCNCGKEVDGSPDKEIWTIWHNGHIYCPQCTNYEGVGFD